MLLHGITVEAILCKYSRQRVRAPCVVGRIVQFAHRCYCCPAAFEQQGRWPAGGAMRPNQHAARMHVPGGHTHTQYPHCKHTNPWLSYKTGSQWAV